MSIAKCWPGWVQAPARSRRPSSSMALFMAPGRSSAGPVTQPWSSNRLSPSRTRPKMRCERRENDSCRLLWTTQSHWRSSGAAKGRYPLDHLSERCLQKREGPDLFLNALDLYVEIEEK